MAPKRKTASKEEPEAAEPAKKVSRKASSKAQPKTAAEPTEAAAANGKEAAETGPTKKGALAVGDVVPDVKLVNEDEQEVSLHELVSEKGCIIFMYPKANTGGCTKQALGFKEHHEEISQAGYQVFGMSFDKSKSQKNWQTKHSLPYSLLTDATGELIKAFGALKAAKSVLRSHVVIGKGGKLLDVRNGISPGDSFAEATAFCKKHPASA